MDRPLATSDARAAAFGGGLSALLLGGAWVFQYGLGYAPCIMCYWQRYAHMAVIATAAAIIAARLIFRHRRILPVWLGPLLLLAGLLVSAGLGGYHVGVEQGWWAGPQACLAVAPGEMGAFDPNNPLAGLDEPVKGPSCADVAWSLLGISMAGWNMIASLIGAAGVLRLGFFDARRTQGQNR